MYIVWVNFTQSLVFLNYRSLHSNSEVHWTNYNSTVKSIRKQCKVNLAKEKEPSATWGKEGKKEKGLGQGVWTGEEARRKERMRDGEETTFRQIDCESSEQTSRICYNSTQLADWNIIKLTI